MWSGRLTFTCAVVVVAAIAVACGDGDSAPASPSPAPGDGETPAPTATFVLGDKERQVPERTGIAELDAIIDGFVLHDTKTLLPHLRYQMLPCTKTSGIGEQPKCRADQEQGAPVEVMPVSTCELELLRPHEFEQRLTGLVQDDLYGVYRATPDLRFPGEYVIVLSRESGDPETEPPVIAIEASVDEGRIVGVNATCFLTPEEAVEMHGLGEPLFLPDGTDQTPDTTY